MDVVILSNGLGNQMSQYAFFEKKSKNAGHVELLYDVKSRNDHNGLELDRIFGIRYTHSLRKKMLFFIYRILGIKKYPILTKAISLLFGLFHVELVFESANYDYNKEVLNNSTKGIRFLEGGWHSEKYFVDIELSLNSLFSFKRTLNDYSKSIAERIYENNSVAVHVRRGDYLSDINYQRFGKVCEGDYFLRAVNFLKEKLDNPVFFIFSNDIKWCREYFRGENFVFVDGNVRGDSWMDLYLMTICKSNINSNSTFSWWGSWLNASNKNFVLCPQYFIYGLDTRDFYPAQWIKL